MSVVLAQAVSARANTVGLGPAGSFPFLPSPLRTAGVCAAPSGFLLTGLVITTSSVTPCPGDSVRNAAGGRSNAAPALDALMPRPRRALPTVHFSASQLTPPSGHP